MAYEVEFRPEAVEDLKAVDRSVAERILSKIRWAAENFDAIPKNPLKGPLRGLFKLRTGDIRILYGVKGKTITIHRIGHRREIYE